jgi:hypothetical protein
MMMLPPAIIGSGDQTMRSSVFKLCLIATLVALVGSSADAAKKAKPPADGSKDPVFAIPKEITLTAEQQTKLDEIKKEQAPKVVEIKGKQEALLTDDQKSARKAAVAKAKAEGKTGKDRQSLINEAIKLGDEQKKQSDSLTSELAKLQLSIKELIRDLLTDEQKPNYKVPKAKKAK